MAYYLVQIGSKIYKCKTHSFYRYFEVKKFTRLTYYSYYRCDMRDRTFYRLNVSGCRYNRLRLHSTECRNRANSGPIICVCRVGRELLDLRHGFLNLSNSRSVVLCKQPNNLSCVYAVIYY